MKKWGLVAVVAVLIGVIFFLLELTLKYSASDDPQLHEKSDVFLSIVVILISTLLSGFGYTIALQGRKTISERMFPPSKFTVLVGGIKCDGRDATRLGWLFAVLGATIVLIGFGIVTLHAYSIWMQAASSF